MLIFLFIFVVIMLLLSLINFKSIVIVLKAFNRIYEEIPFFKAIYKLQGRSQDLNQPLQDIAQNFDDDVITIMLMSLS